MKFLTPSLLLGFILMGCGRSPGSPVGNGYFTTGHADGIEGNPSRISLDFSASGHANDRTTVWRSVPISYDGPWLTGSGLAFCARNQQGQISLFVGDTNGVVAEVAPQLGVNGVLFREIVIVTEHGSEIEIEFQKSGGGEEIRRVTKDELDAMARKARSSGTVVRSRDGSYYR